MKKKQRMLVAFLLLKKCRHRQQQQNRRRHRFWIKDIFVQRQNKGEFNLYLETCVNDHESFRSCFRMTPAQFEYISGKIAPFIEKCEEGRSPVSVRERLAVTLRRVVFIVADL